ncbi:unnamed protein product [Rodentolepis nana]|uniref:Protein kinase domain-containing protein n=1 Tax=Rodentolepis nana TaxID=102285 RepID=A0A0R3SZT4_RODNA|nr:unnamed protein product [Rodentolepis nana]
MSRSQRELSIAHRRRRRHIAPIRNNDNDLVGIPWKEERDIRKAIYHSLREHQSHETPDRRPRLTKVNSPSKPGRNLKATSRKAPVASTARRAKAISKTKAIKASEKCNKSAVVADEEDTDAGISKSPHPRQSRPLPGDLSHQFLFASSYSRSFALLSSRAASRAARRTLARAAAANATVNPTDATPEKSTPIPQRRRRGRPLSSNSPAKSQNSRSPKITKQSVANRKGSSPRRGRKAGANGDFMEVLVEDDDGKIVPQIFRRNSNGKTTPVKSQPQKLPSPHRNGVGRPTLSSSRQQQGLSTATFPEKWQDSRGQPVNVQDFVDFLCSYGTPCMDQRLAWFMNAPGHRCSTALNGGGSARSPNRTSSTTRRGTVRVFPSCSSPKISARPVVAPQQNHKALVLPVARKSVSNWPVQHPEDNDDQSPERRLANNDEAAEATNEDTSEFVKLRKSKSSPVIVDNDVANGVLTRKRRTAVMKQNKKVMETVKRNKKQELKPKSRSLNKKSPLKSKTRKSIPEKPLSSSLPTTTTTSNRSSFPSPLYRSGLRSQALLRTRRQQRLRR